MLYTQDRRTVRYVVGLFFPFHSISFQSSLAELVEVE